MVKVFQNVEAVFTYQFNEHKGDITVNKRFSTPKSRDECLINLAILAGSELSKKHGIDPTVISLAPFDFYETKLLE